MPSKRVNLNLCRGHQTAQQSTGSECGILGEDFSSSGIRSCVPAVHLDKRHRREGGLLEGTSSILKNFSLDKTRAKMRCQIELFKQVFCYSTYLTKVYFCQRSDTNL